MFKRFLVMDLFYEIPKQTEHWIAVEKALPEGDGIYIVKLTNQNQVLAYFCSDQCSRFAYAIRPCFWWDKNDKTPLYNVIEWNKHE